MSTAFGQDAGSVRARKQSSAAISLDYPTLKTVNGYTVRIFLQKYDQYANEVRARHEQLLSPDPGVNSIEPARPVPLNFCIDNQWIRSAIALGRIKSDGKPVASYEELDEETLRDYLEGKAEAKQETVTVSSLDKIVARSLRMDMRDDSAVSRMDEIFIAYHALLSKHGLSWVLKDNQKVAVGHVLSKIRPQNLRNRLENDLKFTHVHLRKDFQGLFSHALRLSEAFELLDDRDHETITNPSNPKMGKRGKSSVSDDDDDDFDPSNQPKPTRKPVKERELPFCPHQKCKKAKKKHLIKDCPECQTSGERKVLYDLIAEEKANDGPSKNTRLQKEAKKEVKDHQVGRLAFDTNEETSIIAKLVDGDASKETTARCDDGSDDSLVCPTVAEPAVLNGIGRIQKIPKVRIKVALEKKGSTSEFTFSRMWIVPQTILQLNSGNLAMQNISYLISDDRLTCEPLIVGLPVLKHLKVDTKTLLEKNQPRLDGIDCTSVGNPTRKQGGFVSRLMLQGSQHSSGTLKLKQLDPQRPRVSYSMSRGESDSFTS